MSPRYRFDAPPGHRLQIGAELLEPGIVVTLPEHLAVDSRLTPVGEDETPAAEASADAPVEKAPEEKPKARQPRASRSRSSSSRSRRTTT